MSRHALATVVSLCLMLISGLTVAADAPSLAPLYSQMQWREVGPYRAGWSTMAVGVPSKPNVFYFGGADGGIWKTVDAGLTWTPLFDQAPSISIGALAVAPSNPDILYIGTGQPEPRYDIVDGAGVYRSDDGGQTWHSLGLTDTRHIGRIWVDPANPDVVLVAAVGHFFGPNDERGVFRSTDGGKHWDKVLFVDGNTGSVDLAADPAHPETLFAATWQMRAYPWMSYYIPQAGPGSGIWKSTDEGKTWTRLTGHGLPSGALGRIGLAVAPGTNDQRVYAIVDAHSASVFARAGQEENASGLYRSDDGGASWTKEGGDDLADWYFDRLAVDPKNPDVLYVMNRSVARSTDGGKSFEWFKGAPGGDDYHFMWINPADDRYMILASDQGTTVSVDGGQTWSQWYNQPTGQFYHVATDDRFPYRIYSGQQDSGTVETESRGDYGELTFREWHPVGGDERSYVIPDNGDPHIVYVGGLGGHVSRYDDRTGQVQNISPWPVSSYGKRPTTVQYRYNWFYPLVAQPHKAHTLYLGAQVIFRTTDAGMHWAAISPDLTGTVKGAAHCDADIPTPQQARDCGYGVVFSIAPSPVDSQVIWAGTDDGLIQLTRDDGKHWQDVTPKGLPLWGRVNQVEASPLDAGTAYAAVDTHRQDEFRPLIYRTHDYGKTWTEITGGLPDSQYVYVVRQDLKNPKLLFAGTNAGVYVSFDDGDRWQPLQLNLPTARVRDLTLHGDDLIAATQGRAIWVLDDIAPLRQLETGMLNAPALLLHPATAIRLRPNENKDTPLPPEVPAGRNPPTGALIDYWIGPDAKGTSTLSIYDVHNRLVRRFSSDTQPVKLTADRYFNDAWLTAPETLSAAQGMHRFVWDLRYPRPRAINYDYSIAAIYKEGGAVVPQGPLVLPGRYTVELQVGGKLYRQSLDVVEDPRVKLDAAALQQQLDFLQSLGAALDASDIAWHEADRLLTDIRTLKGTLAKANASAALQQSLADLSGKVESLQSEAPDHRNLAAINGELASLATEAGDGDRAPPAQYRQAFDLYNGYLSGVLKDWKTLRSQDLPRLNAQLQGQGYAALQVGNP